MSATRQILSPEAGRFRELVIDAVWDDRRFGYMSSDRFIGTCPICLEPIGVHFHGYAARATLNCHGGCTEAEIAQVLDVRCRP